MLCRTPTVRVVLRSPLAHCPSSTSQSQFTRSFSRLQQYSPTPSSLRPSQSLTYRALPINLPTLVPTTAASRSSPTSSSPSATQWSHFTTPHSYSSVRTFTSSRSHRLSTPASETGAPATNFDASARIEEAIEEIQELYGTARDEFEIAAEETEKNSTYGPDDRAAAREELDKLLAYYNGIIEGGDRAVAEEVKRRVGGRIRELEQAVVAMEEASIEH